MGKLCIYDAKEDKQTIREASFLPTLLAKNSILVCNKNMFPRGSFAANEEELNVFDILELFVFINPIKAVAGTIDGIYNHLGIKKKATTQGKKAFLILEELKKQLQSLDENEKAEVITLVNFMKQENWPFADFVLSAIAQVGIESTLSLKEVVLIEEYRDKDLENKIDNNAEYNLFNETEVKESVLKNLTLATEKLKSKRQAQLDYALEVCNMFNTHTSEDTTQNVVVAEAGTGVGKTLGYLSAAMGFLEKNPKHQVLISTYTKTLQKQILSELGRFFPSEEELKKKATIIKGSNNYLCLLNYHALLDNPMLLPKSMVFLGIIARWLKKTEYGDLVGGDLNPLVFDLFPNNLFNFMLNKKEECIYSRCRHFKSCFAMKAKYLARNSNIIISNHALALANDCLGVRHVIFDEAHHLFNSADETFAKEITVSSSYSLRGWVLGNNTNAFRAKQALNGLKARVSTLFLEGLDVGEEEKLLNLSLETALDAIVSACVILPEVGALNRITAHSPKNLMEGFLHEIYMQVLVGVEDFNQQYSKEITVELEKLSDGFLNAAGKLAIALKKIISLAIQLLKHFNNKLLFVKEEEKKPITDFILVFERVFISQIQDMLDMLDELTNPNPNFVYRFVIEKEERQINNIGYYKNYIDPTQPMAQQVLSSLHGVTFTSATISSSFAKKQTEVDTLGIKYLEDARVYKKTFASPFNYKENAQVILINANAKGNASILSNAIYELFKASGGGGLGIFTAVSRLKDVYGGLQNKLANHDIRLMAQHINEQKLVNLIDIFKEDENSCLLATDSGRDGIDIPGNALRLVVFEKVPWSKPDILLKHRVEFFGKNFSESLVKLKLRQAFGRLIRKEDDRGLFVLLETAVPSEFLQAFPDDVGVLKLSLEDSLNNIKQFLGNIK
jgi:ATP-dependent DNA helicase DinG